MLGRRPLSSLPISSSSHGEAIFVTPTELISWVGTSLVSIFWSGYTTINMTWSGITNVDIVWTRR